MPSKNMLKIFTGQRALLASTKQQSFRPLHIKTLKENPPPEQEQQHQFQFYLKKGFFT
jgi:hypothetical protein